MKATTVLTAVNNNPKYSRFIPIFIYQWKRLFPEMSIKIVFIGEIPLELQKYSEYLVSFPEIVGISTVYVAQTIRILYPAILDPSETTLITDIDMLPGNRKYYVDKIDAMDDSKFVVMRPLSCVGRSEIAICYNVARTATWGTLFGIKTVDDIRNFLITNYSIADGIHGGRGWNTDQLLLYKFAIRHPISIMDDSYLNRLDFPRHNYNILAFRELLRSGNFSDAHMYADKCPWTLEQLNVLMA